MRTMWPRTDMQTFQTSDIPQVATPRKIAAKTAGACRWDIPTSNYPTPLASNSSMSGTCLRQLRQHDGDSEPTPQRMGLPRRMSPSGPRGSLKVTGGSHFSVQPLNT